MTPLINGESYSWSQIKCTILNRQIAGITSLKYGTKQEKVNNYGAGNLPVSRGRGPIEPSGSITIEMAEAQALINASPKKSLESIPPFDLVVSYLPEDGVIVNHIIHNCEFTGTSVDTKQGDTSIYLDLELIPSHITF